MTRRCLLSVLLPLTLLLPTSSHAGANAGASAWLSWDEAGLVTDVKAVPSTPFPLFVHMKNVLDVRALAIHLRWSTFDPLGDCYSVLPATATASCGWAVATPPGGDFEGDSSYTWSIQFPPLNPNRTCVRYLVSAASCAGTIPAADFLLASVLVKDSKTAVDTLRILDGASVRGGSLLGVESVDPSEVPARQQTVLVIKGRKFEPGAQVELRNSNVRVAASKVLALGSNTITATVQPPDSPGALLDLVVRLPDGRSYQLPAAITIAAPAALAKIKSSLSRPTNDTSAFLRFDLNAHRIASVNVHDHFDLGVYPDRLESDILLVRRSVGDTMGLFKSMPHDGIDFNCGCQGNPSYVDYAITPPQYATSIGLLSMASGAFNGTGAFNDYNEPALRLRWTFADGDTGTAGQTIRIGKHVRNWRSGSRDCNGSQPYYVLPPDSLSALVDSLSLPSPPWEAGTAYYDAQELPLAPQYRSKRLAALRIAAVDREDNCGNLLFSTEHFLYGFSIWPNFRIADSQGQPLVRKSQTTGDLHGGYLYGTVPVGTRRTTDVTACQVASMAMCYSFAGFPCTVDSLNAFLQRSDGYLPDNVAYVKYVSPSGDSVYFSQLGGVKLRANDTFLVEHLTYSHPLATYRVKSEDPNGRAGRIATYSATSVAVGDTGRVYWSMIPEVADNYTHEPQLHSVTLQASRQLAAKVESLLVRSIPVQLNVHPTAVTGHFVVADGWTSSFRPGGSARGTYSIKDPYDDRNFTKLIQAEVISGTLQDYGNAFTLARYVVPAAQGPNASDGPTTGPLGLGIVASGARRVEIIDPLGRRMLRDVTSGEDVYEIPDAYVVDVSSEHDNGTEADDELTGYNVYIPTAFDGQYTVRVFADNGYSMSASGYSADGVFASDNAADPTAGPTGGVYDVLYSGTGRSVEISHVSTLDVPSVPLGGDVLTVRQCPTMGPVEFVIRVGGEKESDAVDVFDIGGRRRESIRVPPGPGTHTVSWDWRRAGCPPGVYLARLWSCETKPTRFVVLH